MLHCHHQLLLLLLLLEAPHQHQNLHHPHQLLLLLPNSLESPDLPIRQTYCDAKNPSLL
jgi:hypothetical protein